MRAADYKKRTYFCFFLLTAILLLPFTSSHLPSKQVNLCPFAQAAAFDKGPAQQKKVRLGLSFQVLADQVREENDDDRNKEWEEDGEENDPAWVHEYTYHSGFWRFFYSLPPFFQFLLVALPIFLIFKLIHWLRHR